MKVVSIVGARPQFVKASAVSRALRAEPGLREVLVHTGQHYDPGLSQVFFDELEIPAPDHHLGIGSGSHGAQTGRMLEAIERVLVAERPDVVLVYGDTNSTLAGALAAAKLGCFVAHVEAGLRSRRRAMPEEINRVLVDHASDLLFAPTADAVLNLEREGFAPAKVELVGDVMFDVALHQAARAEALHPDLLARLGLAPRSYVLATLHRAENTDDPARLEALVSALAELARDLPVVLPLHPRARAALVAARLDAGAVRLLEPVGYLEMLLLEKSARLVATDSGGVQKEAFFQRVPCVTLRDETEWTELVAAGWNRLAPPVSSAAVLAVLRSALATGAAGRDVSPYGRGDAAVRIARSIASRAGRGGAADSHGES